MQRLHVLPLHVAGAMIVAEAMIANKELPASHLREADHPTLREQAAVPQILDSRDAGVADQRTTREQTALSSKRLSARMEAKSRVTMQALTRSP